MPLIESQPDALASVYARSLFELAESKGGQEKIERTLGELEDIIELAREDGRFSEFLSSRVLGTAARDGALVKIFEGRVTGLTLKFLRLLNEKGRLGLLIPITTAFDQMVQERFGRVEVDVYTPGPVGADELRRLKDRLGATLGKEVIVHPYTDTTMIGGVKLRIGDQLVDASVSTRLRKMRDQVEGRGGAQIRANAKRILDESGGS